MTARRVRILTFVAGMTIPEIVGLTGWDQAELVQVREQNDPAAQPLWEGLMCVASRELDLTWGSSTELEIKRFLLSKQAKFRLMVLRSPLNELVGLERLGLEKLGIVMLRSTPTSRLSDLLDTYKTRHRWGDIRKADHLAYQRRSAAATKGYQAREQRKAEDSSTGR